MQTENGLLFSTIYRKDFLKRLQTDHFDLLVIGGGATGCGIALDAVSRGLKTALIEKDDFASGTSSKSTKLIHGGLRYLKQLDIGLVRETGTERAIVNKLAPHLVLPEKMLLPIIENGTYGKWAAWFGLGVYDWLAAVKPEDKRKMLSKQEALSIEPLLDKSKLKGAGYYAEYRTDDARLTLEMIKTAYHSGATAVNYVTMLDLNSKDGNIESVRCRDEESGETFDIRATKVVSAAGPWVDDIRSNDGEIGDRYLHLTKGIHLVFDREKLPVKHSIYFDTPDGRMCFAIPRGKVTYVGTTDTSYTDDKDRIQVTQKDAEYVMRAIHAAFPSVQLSIADVQSSWAGLRPLIHEKGKSPSELSRKDEIFLSKSGLISIAGGKLTGYRKMAERVVDIVVDQLGLPDIASCSTKDIALTQDGFTDSEEAYRYISTLEPIAQQAKLDKHYAWYLVTLYGRAAEEILDGMSKFSSADPEVALIRSELNHCYHHEMVSGLSDFYVRRTGRLYFDIESIDRTRSEVLADLVQYGNWDEDRSLKEEKKLDMLMSDARSFISEKAIAELTE